MTQVRVEGYVVGHDIVGGELWWTVKVKDPTSANQSKKFLVHSLYPGTMLTKPSVDVSFVVAPIQVGQEQVMKAVDVAIGEVVSPVEHAAISPESEEAMFVIATEIDGQVSVWFTGMESAEEVRKEVRKNGEDLVAFMRIPHQQPQDADKDVFFTNSMQILHGLSCNEELRPAFEFLLTQVFISNQSQQQP